MTALERAKRFVQTTAAKTALVIVPLAMAAPATASSIEFNPASGDAQQSIQTRAQLTLMTGSGDFEALPNGGVKFYGDYSWGLESGTSGGGYQTKLTLTLTGTGSGDVDVASIPAHFDYLFNLGPNNPFSNFSSSIEFFFFGGASVGSRGPLSNGNGILYQEDEDLALTGWDPTDPQDLGQWKVVLQANFLMQPSSIGVIELTIPRNSIDIMPAADPGTQDPAVPEPASLLLLGSGVAVLARRRHRRRQMRD